MKYVPGFEPFNFIRSLVSIHRFPLFLVAFIVVGFMEGSFVAWN